MTIDEPRWPEDSGPARMRLFEDLQDIAVFVEDVGDEVFYCNLLGRVFGKRWRIREVVGCGGRLKVPEVAATYAGMLPAVFIIDGDFEWVRNEPGPGDPRVIRLESYCVENLIMCPVAAKAIFAEDKVLTQAEAASALQLEAWIEGIRKVLVDYACACAAAHKCLSMRTMRNGFEPLVVNCKRRRAPILDAGRVALKISEYEAEATRIGCRREFDQTRLDAMAFAEELPEPLDVVSGKSLLLPLLQCHMKSHGASYECRTLRNRLGLRCEIRRFDRLVERIAAAVAG